MVKDNVAVQSKEQKNEINAPDVTGVKDFNIIGSWKYGKMIYNDYDEYVGASIREYGQYCEEELTVFKTFMPDNRGVFLDIGANIGAFSIPMAQYLTKGIVHAIEPVGLSFQTLAGNCAINNITNTQCHNIAFGQEMKLLKLPVFRGDVKCNFGSLSINAINNLEGNIVSVPQQTLDNFWQSHIQMSVQLIKIDVEGMELDVLKGGAQLLQQNRPFLFIENDRIEKSQKLIEYLWSVGYNLYWHVAMIYDANNFHKNTKNVWRDNVALYNMIAIPTNFNTQINVPRINHSAIKSHPLYEGLSHMKQKDVELSESFQSIERKLLEENIDVNEGMSCPW